MRRGAGGCIDKNSGIKLKRKIKIKRRKRTVAQERVEREGSWFEACFWKRTRIAYRKRE